VRPALRAAAALLAAAFLGAGCAAAPVAPALVLDSQAFPKDAEVAGVARDVEARVVNHFIFWVPTRTLGPSLSEAVAEALERGNGHVLTNARVERIAWYVPLLYGEYGWLVRGDVVRLRKPPPPLAP
jgi:hypothetical protein